MKVVAVVTIFCLLAFRGYAQEGPPNPSLDIARQLNQAFVQVAEKVSPAVVVVNVTHRGQRDSEGDDGDSPWNALPEVWRRFHRQFERRAPEETHGEGSGVIIRSDGYILTNGHVVQDADAIDVRLKNGRLYRATVRGIDLQSDLAVVKIDATNLPTAVLADSSKTQVGEFAIAIGAPFSLEYTLTFGHVSAKGRSDIIEGPEGGSMDQDFIQTDAMINPGNSGGPLVNINGEVIGINTIIRGLRTGIGFAIPSSMASQVSDKLIADGKFPRAWLGLSVSSLRDDPDLKELVKGVDEGVVVRSIPPDGPAAKSALRPSDVITQVDGRQVASPQELRSEVRGKTIGQPVSLRVFRNGQTLLVNVSPGEWVDPTENTKPKAQTTVAASQRNPPEIGLTIQPLTHQLAAQFGVEMTPGVVVSSVQRGSLADRKHIKPGDIIVSVDQQPVTSAKQFREALKRADLNKGLLVNLVSGKTARFEILKQASK